MRSASSFLAIAAIFQVADGAQVVGAGMLRGLHDTRVPMIFTFVGYWAIGIGIGAWLAFWARLAGPGYLDRPRDRPGDRRGADDLALEPARRLGSAGPKRGIIIPDTAKEKPQEGEVVAVGSGARAEDGKVTPLDVKAGDRILFGKWSGTEVKIDGEDLLIMKESDILGIVG